MLTSLPFHIAQTGSAVDTVTDCVSPFFSKSEFALSCGSALSEQMARGWDKTWDLFITNPNGIYIALVNIGRIFALFSIILFIYQFLRNALSDESYNSLSDLIWPIIVIVLLANDAALLRQSSSAIRAIINQTNTDVVTLADNALQFEKHLDEVINFTSAENVLRDIRSQCNGITDTAQLNTCLEEANQRAQAVVTAYTTAYPASVFGNRLLAFVQSAITDIKDNPAILIDVGLARLSNSVVNIAVQTILAALQSAFQYLVELSFLLTAMLGPLALGLTLSPMGGKPLYAWIIAFFSVGLAKLSFNIVSAILVTMIYESGPLDPMVDMLLLGLLSPVLSFAIAAGGGMAVFNGILSTVQQITMGLIPVGVGASLRQKGG